MHVSLTRHNEKQVSIVGSAYFQPIADLIDHLLSRKLSRPKGGQAAYFENGYAVSIVLLLVAMFESYAIRARYIDGSRDLPNRCGAVKGLLKLYPRLPNRKALEDVYVLRDALIHNHLWSITFSFDERNRMSFLEAVKDPASGDGKHTSRVNPRTRRTKTLRLHVVPTRIDRRDVEKVFTTLWALLLYLEFKNRQQCYVSHVHVKYRGKRVLFGDLLKDLKLAV